MSVKRLLRYFQKFPPCQKGKITVTYYSFIAFDKRTPSMFTRGRHGQAVRVLSLYVLISQ